MRRLIALLALLPTVASSQAVCSAAAQSKTACSAVEQSITITSACECVASVAAPAGPFGGHATLADGLVSYWPLDEESGVRADLVGSNDLTDNNTVGFASVTGPPNFPAGKAASFVAANSEYLKNAAADFSGITDAFTVSIWCSLADVAATYKKFVTLYNGATPVWYFDAYQSDARFLIGADYHGNSLSNQYPLNTWVHAVIWVNAGDTKVNISINGGSTITSATGAAPTYGTRKITLGSDDGAAHYFNGLMAHVAVWSRALTDQERTDLYNSGAGLFYED